MIMPCIYIMLFSHSRHFTVMRGSSITANV
uniref:Uncharacterized protein n=1 Tax=Anguilla anguilla TaxID=7936 RepID=A0A0E9W791_ANGAN